MSDFSQLVQHHFGFLEQQGFLTDTVNERLVTYQNGTLFFQLGLGRRGEVGLTLDRSPPSWYFGLEFYLKEFFPEAVDRLGDGVTASKLEMDIELGRLALLLKEFGTRLFVDGEKVIAKLTIRAFETLQ